MARRKKINLLPKDQEFINNNKHNTEELLRFMISVIKEKMELKSEMDADQEILSLKDQLQSAKSKYTDRISYLEHLLDAIIATLK